MAGLSKQQIEALRSILTPEQMEAIDRALRPQHYRRIKKDRSRWPTLLQEYWAGDYLVVPLASSDELEAEGLALEHCVGGASYILNCLLGAMAIFSIRNKKGERVATLSLELDPVMEDWKIGQLRGFQNELFEDEEIVTQEFDGNRVQVNVNFETNVMFYIAHDVLRAYKEQFSAERQPAP